MIKNTLILGGWWVLVVHLYQRVLLSIEKQDFGAIELDWRAVIVAAFVATVLTILIFGEVVLSTLRRPRRLVRATLEHRSPQPGNI